MELSSTKDKVTYRLPAKIYVRIKKRFGKARAEEWAKKHIHKGLFPLVRPYLKEELNKA